MNKPIPDRRDLPPRTWRRRNILTLLAGAPTLLINIKKSQAENFDYQGNPFRDRFQSFRQTFRVEAAVPVSIEIKCAMTKTDYPKLVHLLALENPFPEIAKYRFSPACGRARIATRIRMRTTAPLVVLANMSDGSVGLTEKTVNVTLGACN